jgi:hypothetical protein
LQFLFQLDNVLLEIGAVHGNPIIKTKSGQYNPYLYISKQECFTRRGCAEASCDALLSE